MQAQKLRSPLQESAGQATDILYYSLLVVVVAWRALAVPENLTYVLRAGAEQRPAGS